MLDAVHLVVEVTVLEITNVWVCFGGVVGSDGCSAGAGCTLLAISEKGSDLAELINSNMRREEYNDVSICWAVAAECTPSGLSSKWESRKTSKWE